MRESNEDFLFDEQCAPNPKHGFILIEGRTSWKAEEHAAVEKGAPCYVCQGRKLRKNEICLVCHRSGLDGSQLLNELGKAVGSRINPGWEETEPKPVGTKYEPKGLRGGCGN